MIYFTAHTFKCVCHCRRVMFRVLGMYNFDVVPKPRSNKTQKHTPLLETLQLQLLWYLLYSLPCGIGK